MQRRRAEAGHHVQGVANQFDKSIIRTSAVALLKRYYCHTEAARGPRKQYVDGNKWSVIAGERLAQLRAKNSERTHVFRYLAAYRCA